MARYASKETAYNGVAKYILEKYNVPTEKKNVLGFNDVNSIMIKFIESIEHKPFKSIEMNARFVQKNFTKFTQFMQRNYEKS